MEIDVLIVGAGPIGSYLSNQLSKKGYKVTIIDKKSVIGKYACSGLISTRLKNFVTIQKDFLEHEIKGAILHSPNYDVEIRKKKTQAYVINRVKFDQYLLEKTKQAGTEIMLRTSFQDFKTKKEKIHIKTSKGIIIAKFLVGADGAGSIVRRKSNLKGHLTVVNGIISYFNERNTSDLVELFYGKKIAPNFFAWKIPRGKTTEYGLATTKNHINYLKKFLKLQGKKLSKFYAHPICFGEQESVADRLLLVGDAAVQVKPFSGGGIIYGLISAEIAQNTILKAFQQNNLSKNFLEKNYQEKWRKKLWSKIELGLNIRHLLNNLNDKELDCFFEMLNTEKKNIELFGDMDFL